MQLTENYDSYIAAASGDEPGAAIFMSVFFYKKLVSYPSAREQDVRHPVRRSAHLLTDHIQVNIRAAFDDQLIMNMTDDEAVPESFHSVAKAVAADGLDDILHKLRTIGFDTFPLLCGSNSLIGDEFAAILVFSDTGFHVGQQAA